MLYYIVFPVLLIVLIALLYHIIKSRSKVKSTTGDSTATPSSDSTATPSSDSTADSSPEPIPGGLLEETAPPVIAPPETPPPTEPIASDTHKFWEIENEKEKEREDVFTTFGIPIKENKPIENKPPEQKTPKKDTSFKTKNYKLRHLKKLLGIPTDITPHLEKIKDLHKDAPLSRLRKISKKSKDDYLKLLMEAGKNEEVKEETEKEDSMDKLSTLPDKRTKLINKLRRMHH